MDERIFLFLYTFNFIQSNEHALTDQIYQSKGERESMEVYNKLYFSS